MGKHTNYKKISSQLGWLMPIISATQEEELRRIMIEASPGKKLARLILANKLGVVVQGMIL
jgi:hypothetical protein